MNTLSRGNSGDEEGHRAAREGAKVEGGSRPVTSVYFGGANATVSRTHAGFSLCFQIFSTTDRLEAEQGRALFSNTCEEQRIHVLRRSRFQLIFGRSKCRLRGCNLQSTWWETRSLRAPLTYTVAPHVRLPGGLQMLGLSNRTEFNRILTHFPDVPTIRITCEAEYRDLTLGVRRGAQRV